MLKLIATVILGLSSISAHAGWKTEILNPLYPGTNIAFHYFNIDDTAVCKLLGYEKADYRLTQVSTDESVGMAVSVNHEGKICGATIAKYITRIVCLNPQKTPLLTPKRMKVITPLLNHRHQIPFSADSSETAICEHFGFTSVAPGSVKYAKSFVEPVTMNSNHEFSAAKNASVIQRLVCFE